ncbi:MAG: IS110 family transposase [Thermodesulfobacteriota bacterium]|nr:IS110 family transposase [Thermodesulfobacteriota bacterium]
MKFYRKQHKYYCGIDLHTNKMYLCILDEAGEIQLHRNIKRDREIFLSVIKPFGEDIVVAVECMFTWYWIADLCAQKNIPFVLGHALYMKAIHGGKAKNDTIDSKKIAVLFRGGMIPQAYVYPQKMRSTRGLMRRRNHLMRKRAELFAHIQNTKSQYNLPDSLGCIAKPKNRNGVAERFEDSSVQNMINADLSVIEAYDPIIAKMERDIIQMARHHDPVAHALLNTIPGIGKILSLVILYEIGNIKRFPSVQDFASYARPVKSVKESNGKKYGSSGKKIGNAHLKWAFSEAAVLFLKGNEPGKRYLHRLANKHGKGKALSILAHKLGRAVYFMLKNKKPFDQNIFLGL